MSFSGHTIIENTDSNLYTGLSGLNGIEMDPETITKFEFR